LVDYILLVDLKLSSQELPLVLHGEWLVGFEYLPPLHNNSAVGLKSLELSHRENYLGSLQRHIQHFADFDYLQLLDMVCVVDFENLQVLQEFLFHVGGLIACSDNQLRLVGEVGTLGPLGSFALAPAVASC
jgi:hypothetical protein